MPKRTLRKRDIRRHPYAEYPARGMPGLPETFGVVLPTDRNFIVHLHVDKYDLEVYFKWRRDGRLKAVAHRSVEFEVMPKRMGAQGARRRVKARARK